MGYIIMGSPEEAEKVMGASIEERLENRESPLVC